MIEFFLSGSNLFYNCSKKFCCDFGPELKIDTWHILW